jgi:hypothetical protein
VKKMSHLDEGTLHAYADGELASRRHAEVEEHLSLCAECRARLEAARSATGRATELLAELEPEPVHAPAWREIEDRASARARVTPRRSWLKPSLAAAAMIVVAFGLGWFSRASWAPVGALPLATTDRPAEATPMADRDEGLVPTEQAAPEAASRLAGERDPNRSVVTEPREVGEAGRGQAAAEAEEVRAKEPEAAAAKSVAGAEGEADRVEPLAEEQQVRAAEPAAPPADLRLRGQLRAARERRDQPQPSAAEAERVQAQLEDSQPTLSEFRTQTTDELKRQLAVPVQLAQAAVWLGAPVRTLPELELVAAEVAPGSVIEGAVPGRPAVRLSYRDATGQSIVLDQQWLGDGAALYEGEAPSMLVEPSGWRAYRWIDERGYRMVLRGTISGDSLRALAGRLR